MVKYLKLISVFFSLLFCVKVEALLLKLYLSQLIKFEVEGRDKRKEKVMDSEENKEVDSIQSTQNQEQQEMRELEPETEALEVVEVNILIQTFSTLPWFYPMGFSLNFSIKFPSKIGIGEIGMKSN